MAAWIKQKANQVAKYGAKKAPWHCVWDEPDGTRRFKSCGPGTKGRRLAQEKADRINSQLTLGTYESDRNERETWGDFFAKYNETLTAEETSGEKRSGSVREILVSMKHFERILSLKDRPMSYITTERIDKFRTARRTEKGKNPGSMVSPATINKDLRHIKAALRLAVEWKYLGEMPNIKFDREPEKLPTFISSEDFAKIYGSCEKAALPDDFHAGAPAWWQAMLVFGQMTGWRRGETLTLKWGNVDLEKGHAVTRAAFNKGRRDEITPLHPVVVEHLKRIKPDAMPLVLAEKRVFPWSDCDEYIYGEFARIQDAAGIKLNCPNKDLPWHGECTDCCHRYSFHDERRGFASANAMNMTREALQALMRHKSPETTARYINMAGQLNPAIANLHVPPVLKAGATG